MKRNYVLAVVGGDYSPKSGRVSVGTKVKSSSHDLITPGETIVVHYQAASEKYNPGFCQLSEVVHKADSETVALNEKGEEIFNLVAIRPLTSRENFFTLEELKPYFQQCWDDKDLSYVGKLRGIHYIDLTELFVMFPELLTKIENRLYYGI